MGWEEHDHEARRRATSASASRIVRLRQVDTGPVDERGAVVVEVAALRFRERHAHLAGDRRDALGDCARASRG